MPCWRTWCSLEIHHQCSRPHCVCTPSQTANIAALRKLPTWAQLYTSAYPSETPSVAVCGRQTSHIHTEEEKIITLNKFGCLWELWGQQSWGWRGAGCHWSVQASNLINWLLIYWDGLRGTPRLWKQTPGCPTAPTLRVAWNWGQLTVLQTHAPTSPYSSHCLLINSSFLGWGEVGGSRLGKKH